MPFMPFSTPRTGEEPEDLQALRRVIEDLARQHRIDLSNPEVIARLTAGDATVCDAATIEPQRFAELSSMLRLLFRLQGSSSEDLGVSGLCRLWERHQEILRRFGSGGRTNPSAPAVSY